MLTNANLKHRCNAFCYVLQVRSRLTTVPVSTLVRTAIRLYRSAIIGRLPVADYTGNRKLSEWLR